MTLALLPDHHSGMLAAADLRGGDLRGGDLGAPVERHARRLAAERPQPVGCWVTRTRSCRYCSIEGAPLRRGIFALDRHVTMCSVTGYCFIRDLIALWRAVVTHLQTDRESQEMKRDPFRNADNWTRCPECEGSFAWNREDGLTGQVCSCGHVFTGHERRALVV